MVSNWSQIVAWGLLAMASSLIEFSVAEGLPIPDKQQYEDYYGLDSAHARKSRLIICDMLCNPDQRLLESARALGKAHRDQAIEKAKAEQLKRELEEAHARCQCAYDQANRDEPAHFLLSLCTPELLHT